MVAVGQRAVRDEDGRRQRPVAEVERQRLVARLVQVGQRRLGVVGRAGTDARRRAQRVLGRVEQRHVQLLLLLLLQVVVVVVVVLLLLRRRHFRTRTDGRVASRRRVAVGQHVLLRWRCRCQQTPVTDGVLQRRS